MAGMECSPGGSGAPPELLMCALAALPFGVVITDVRGVVCWANSHLAEQTGCPAAEIVGLTVALPGSEKPGAGFDEILAVVLRSGQPWKGELALPRRAGGVCTSTYTVAPVRNAQREVTHLVCTGTPAGEEDREDRVCGSTQDITGRKLAEELLRHSEERYATIFAAMAEGVVFQDANGVIEGCNPGAERILGLTAGQMLGRRLVDLPWQAIQEDGSPFPGETHPSLVSLRTGRPLSNVVIGVHKPDGTLAWISVNSYPLMRGEGGRAHGVVATFADVSERKKSDQNYADLYDAAPDMFVSVDIATKTIVQCNRTLERLSGYTREEIIGRPVTDMFAPECVDAERQMHDALRLHGEVHHREMKLKRKQGAPLDISISITTVRDERGQPVRSRAVWRDITEQKRMEAALKQSEQSYRLLFELGSDALLLAETGSGRIRDINAAAISLYGYSQEEWLSMRYADLLAEPGGARPPEENTRTHEALQWHRKKSAEAFPVEILASHFRRGGVLVSLITVRDITEPRRLEEERARLEEMLRQS